MEMQDDHSPELSEADNPGVLSHGTVSSATTTIAEQCTESNEQRVARLARVFTAESVLSNPRGRQEANPFLSTDKRLDPLSQHFDARLWVKTLLRTFSNEPTRYPRHSLGVSYRNLDVYGYGSSTDYQKDVINVLLRAPLMLREWLARRKTRVSILRNFDGIVQSGELLLVLGRPGSGVSTLLKTIAGQTHGLNLSPTSEFNYQGIPWEVMHKNFSGEVIYQAETDVNFPHLTVGQTLMFAALGRTPKNRLPGVTRKRYAEHLRDVVMAMVGISHTINTKVGDDFVRGVSGGERKRVGIAEVMLNQSAIQCWDNSTRGLDSETALEFTRILRLSTEMAESAAIVAMYQASQASYDLFDKVALLYEGQQIYFGPRDAAKQYFVDMGYYCPEKQTTADFLTSLTNPAERVVQFGFERRVPRTPDEFAEAWRKSAIRAQLLEETDEFAAKFPTGSSHIEKFREARKAQQSSLILPRSPYTLSIPMQIKLCILRGFQRLLGDKLFFSVTVLGNLVMSLVLGSVFYNLSPYASDMNSRCALLFFAILFNALSSALEIFPLYAARPIIEKHARYALVYPFTEAVASIICELPSKVLSAIAFNIPLYFMANLRRETGHVFIFLLFGFVSTITMSMIIRTIGQTSKTIHQALTPTAMLILILVIYTGFVLPTDSMQHWLRWINYLNPIAYAYESLVANEFAGRDFPCETFIPAGPAYLNITAAERACSVSGALPGASFIDGSLYIGSAYGYYSSHIWRNLGILIGYIVFFTFCYIAAAERLSMSVSQGEVLIFRRNRVKPHAAPKNDEESHIGNNHNRLEAQIPTSSPKSAEPLQENQTSIFNWRNVCFEVPVKGGHQRLLDQVDGWVKPGTLTALMGASGAGKTTLLNVLASRVTTGVVTGDMFVNGSPRDNSFQRKTGYVQQQDLHLETATVREALRFSALLRQPAHVSKAEKHAYVESVIRMLKMEAYAEAVIGIPGEGLNIEQRKRLSIGVELAAKPELLLFLDEPTSGLDSQTAWSVASLMRELSDHGQAILCTIHQPSALLFEKFDRILLLAKGGKTLYFGELGKDSRIMINYFERHGAPRCSAAENPAEWMLKVTGAAPGAKTDRDWPATWRQSPEFVRVQSDLDELKNRRAVTAHAASGDRSSPASYAATFQTQLYECTRRVFQQYWRTPSYIYAKLILCGGTSLLIGVSFYKMELTLQGLQDQMFSIFMLLVIFAFLVYQTMPHFIAQRTQYEARERPSKTYSWQVFVLANIIAELPWNTLASLLVFFPFYYLVGMESNAILTNAVHERGVLMFLLTWSFMLMECTMADMVVAAASTAEVGATIALLMFAMTLIFCGVIVAPMALPRFWIFMYRVSPFNYLIGALLSVGVGNAKVTCAEKELLTFQPAAGQTCGQYMEAYRELAGGDVYNPQATQSCQFCSMVDTNVFLSSIGTSIDESWRNYGILWAYIVFNIAMTLLLYWVIRVPKSSRLNIPFAQGKKHTT